MIAERVVHAKRSSASAVRILIVDDSVVVRRLLTHALAEPYEIVGHASSADIALEKMAALTPDLLILDIHMPGMSGMELLPIVRERYPQMRVLLFSRSLPESVSGTIDGLMNGATDFLMKPAEDVLLGDSIAIVREQIALKIRMLFPGRNVGLSVASPNDREAAAKRQLRQRDVLAIGVSTGGPTALTSVLQQLPRDYHLPIVIVQHMPPVFTTLLANRIKAVSGLDIAEAVDGELLQAGRAYLAPGNFHMRLVRDAAGVRIALDQGPMECSCRPSVDVLFRSVAEVFGGAVIATMLTGMGQDGLKGVQELHRLGAYVIAQDEASSVVWGMPGAVAQAGLAHEVLDVNEIAHAIQRQTGRKRHA